jgi:hypothetical protein
MFFVTEDITDFPVLGKNLRIPSKNCPLDSDAVLPEIRALMPYQFRLYDNARELHYEGYYDGLNGDDEAVAEPLEWAANYTQCTIQDIRGKNGKWQEIARIYD